MIVYGNHFIHHLFFYSTPLEGDIEIILMSLLLLFLSGAVTYCYYKKKYNK